jgi:ribose-phosphate pyrophosphokinase
MENVMLISGSSHLELSNKIASCLDIELCDCVCDRFSNTEVRIFINESIRNKDVYIIQTGTFLSDKSFSVNDYIMETLVMIDACKRSMARSVSLIMPNYPYARQDKKDKSRAPISSKLLANLLTCAGIDRLIVMELHSAQIQGFFDIPVDNLYSTNLFVKYLEENVLSGYDLEQRREKFIMVSPDAGSTKRTLKYAEKMRLGTAIMHKQRNYTVKNRVDKTIVICDREELIGKTAIICDDMCDTGGTLIKSIETLVKNGVRDVICVLTHGILSGPAIERINCCDYISEVIVCDTIPQVLNLERCPKLKIVDISGLLSDVIYRIQSGGSISKLFS